MADVFVVLLTLVAAILIGYIVGKSSAQKKRPPPSASVIGGGALVGPAAAAAASASGSGSARSPKRKLSANVTASKHGLSISPLDQSVTATPRDAPVVATPGLIHQLPTPLPSPRAGTEGATSSTPADAANASAAGGSSPDSNQSTPNSTPRGSRRGSEAEDRRGSRASKRIVIVAKQLPVSTRRNPEGGWTVEWEDNRSFVSGLRVLKNRGLDVKWVGCPNTNGEVLSKDEQDDYEELLQQHDCVPVFLLPGLADKFFNSFCKGVLWPMLHYVLPQSNAQFSATWDELWQAYTAANALYASVVSHCVDSPTDTIWVHNYHLLLLPSFLRTKLPRAKIGLFIHTPFPSSDVFRVLPTRQNILSSIMAADLLGFHTFDYARHFLSCTKRVMDLDFETLAGGSLGIKYNGRFVSILISHVGIDSGMFCSIASTPSVKEMVAALRAKYGSRKIVLSTGDLDAVKGGLLKFQAYERFFTRFPAQASQMVFVEMLLPNKSMTLDHSQDMGTLLHKQVESIHTQFGRECFDLLELPAAFPLATAVAYYQAADVCIASQFWDGLNLMPFEYTACQDAERPGALVISEFMGCSRSLNGVLRVNPWSLEAVASAINVALGLSIEERKANHARRFNYVMNHTIEQWALTFLEHLDRATKLCEGMNYVQVGWGSNVKLMGLRSDFTHLEEEVVTAIYRKTERRVLLLDYDGTLTPAEKTAHKSRLMGPTKLVKKLLQTLSADPENVVFIMSGRTRSTLAEWFPSSDFPNLGLAAEKGLFLRWPERLTYMCRQDLRRDAALRRRVEERRIEQEKAKEIAMAAQAAITSEARSQAFVAASAAEQAENEKTDSASSTAAGAAESNRNRALSAAANSSDDDSGSDSKSRAAGDAHLLVDESALVVDELDWEFMIAFDDVSWKAMALEIIRSYTEQTDGSWIEDKEFAIVWHYEQADPEYGRMQAAELQKYLVKILANPAVDVVRYDYNRILEVKPHGVSKGLAATAILEELFNLHQEKMKGGATSPGGSAQGRPTSPHEEHHLARASSMRTKGSSSNLASMGGSPSPPASPVLRSRASLPTAFHGAGSSAAGASNLPPFLFCVGDDRSDEDMFLSVANKDYLEGKLRPCGPTAAAGLVHRGQSAMELLPSQAGIQRSMSASAISSTGSSSHSRHASAVVPTKQAARAGSPSAAQQDLDEKTAALRRKNRMPDPYTFTVCVGMKPSNAHYYLHDDEEVVRMLQAMATSSQRMAATRAADKKKLTETALPAAAMASSKSPTNVAVGMRPLGSPIASGAFTGSSGGLAALVSNSAASSGSGSRPSAQPANPWSLRPTDIPTSPSLPANNAQLQYAMQQATAERLRQKINAAQMSAAQSLGARPSSQSLAAQAQQLSEDDEDLDDEDDDDEEDDEAFARNQKPQMVKAGGGGGMRRM